MGRGRALALGVIALALVGAMSAVVAHSRPDAPVIRTFIVRPPDVPDGAAVDMRSGRLFVSAFDETANVGRVYLFDLRSGRLLRVIGPFSPNVGVEVDEGIGRAFVNDMSGGVAALDARTGAHLTDMVAGGDRTDMEIDARRHRVYLSNNNGDSVEMFDERTGRSLQGFYLGLSYEPVSLVVDDRTGRLVTVNRGNHSVSVLDPDAGRVLRTIVTGIYASVVAYRGQFLVTTNHGLLILDAESGRGVRTIPLRGMTDATLSLDARAGRVLVATNAGMSVVDPRRGTVVGTVPAVPRYEVAVDDRAGRAFAVDAARGIVRVLDTRGGAIVNTVAVGLHPGFPALDTRRGRVFLAAQDSTDGAGRALGVGTMTVLDARTGAVLRTVAVGVNPTGVVVDERTGQTFVVNGGGTVDVPDRWDWVPGAVRRLLPFLPPPGSRGRVVPGSISVLAAAL